MKINFISVKCSFGYGNSRLDVFLYSNHLFITNFQVILSWLVFTAQHGSYSPVSRAKRVSEQYTEVRFRLKMDEMGCEEGFTISKFIVYTDRLL